MDTTKEMIGTFSPQPEPYTHVMPEETTPSGMFARGSYSARSKVSVNRVRFDFMKRINYLSNYLNFRMNKL